MSSGIKLTFVNESNDTNNSQVVIFQKNVATDFDELAVAWLVIENCGPDWTHPFTYPMNMYVSSSDSWGNYSPQLSAINGQQFSIKEGTSGEMLTLTGQASSPTQLEVLNGLTVGAANANIYKDGNLLAIKQSLTPGQKAVFEFKPTIWIGAVSQIQQGEIMDSAVLSQINTELSLLGIQSADIVMTGGGSGTAATPFKFSLANIVIA